MAKKIETSKIMGNFELPKPKKKVAKEVDAVKAIHKNEVQKTTINMPIDMHRRLRIRAFEEGTSMTKLILTVIGDYLSED